MKKNKRSNDWIVGLSIISALVLIVVATLWLQQADIGGKRQSLTARFRDVGNMQVGNSVVIRGVVAGRVKGIELADSGWVTAEFDLKDDVTLPVDPVVLIQAATLFGEWQAMVTPRSGVPDIREVHAQLNDVDFAPQGSLPGAVLPDIAQLTTVAGGIAGNVASLAERVRTAFDEQAARELRTTLANFNRMSNDLARMVQRQSRNLDSIALAVRSGAGTLSEASESLARTIGRADSATADGELQQILSDTRVATTNVRDASERLNTLMSSLELTGTSVRGAMDRMDSVLAKVDRGEGSLGLLITDQSLYRSSDSLLIEMRALIADVKKDPRRYFRMSVF